MKKIASFTVNHDKLEKGMYISRIDGVRERIRSWHMAVRLQGVS